ncbi:MAG: hypothetical protein JSW71_04015 [Gemmatimonadota bacterium]|nr:MAG: hypothetical protein JSW71_04015 [Gemmatimonadota bacterium]
MTLRRRLLRVSLSVLGAVLLGSCGADDGDGCNPTDPTCNPPRAGQIALTISTPNFDDRAVVLKIRGEFTAAQAATGYRLFQAADAQTFIVVATGVMERESSVLTIDVPDLTRLVSYSATISEVAASDYRLRQDMSGYETSFAQVSQ